MKLYHQYIEDVKSGKFLSCLDVHRAIDRHLTDLEKSKKSKYKYYFDETAADRVIKFVMNLQHTDGEYAGQFFNMQPFQAFILAMIFGWRKKKNKKRRFKKAYIEIARKNGKTELLAAICLYMLWKDGENGAQVYTFATEKAQASILFEVTVEMLRKLWKYSPSAAKQIGWNKSKSRLYLKESNEFMEPISDDAEKKDGFRPHLGAGDEAHAWKTMKTLKVLETGMLNRLQALIIMITTAGPNTFGPAFKFRKVCKQILSGIVKSDQIFSIMYGLDKGDDPHDQSKWVKASPMLGYSISMDSMIDAYEMAIVEGEDAWIEFLTKNLNRWSNTSAEWISLEDWQSSGTKWQDIDFLRGRKCWIGIESSRFKELVSVVHVFPKGDSIDDGFWVLPRYLLPERSVSKMEKRDGVTYADWIKEGYIKKIKGRGVEDSHILDVILQSHELYDIQYVEYDPKHMYKLMNTLQDEHKIDVSAFAQSAANFTSPTKEIERQVLLERFDHGHHPVLEWQVSNVELLKRNDVISFDRTVKNTGSVIALAMAMGGYETDTPVKKVSKYNTQSINHD